MDPGSMPVGSVIPWASEDLTWLSDGSGWVVCDGAPYYKDQFPKLFDVLGYSCGGEGDLFCVPNLTGAFPRGHNYADLAQPGALMTYRTKSPGWNVSLQYIPTKSHPIYYGSRGSDASEWTGGASEFAFGGGDQETRPVNVFFYYIIKLDAHNHVPVGSLVPYAGSDQTALQQPWVRCNGSQLDLGDERYGLLHTLMGRRFTGQDAPAGKFSVPQLKGLFIRGLDAVGRLDPDADYRSAAPDGTGGAVMGSLQAYATSARSFRVRIDNYPPPNGYRATNFSGLQVATRDSEGGSWDLANANVNSETRPMNAAVQHYIKTFASVGDDFPIGGIIAIPGQNTDSPSPDHWLPCDGSLLSKFDERGMLDLFQALSGCWGRPLGTKFNLPDLRGRVLRNSDDTPAGQADVWGDPDRGRRSQSNSGGALAGTGTVQGWATGVPKNPLTLPLKYPTGAKDVINNASGEDVSEYNTNYRQFSVFGSDAETAPYCVIVRWYIKYKN